MTELETLKRAKMYLEHLARGINPLDGTVIPEEELVNNVRISRCFFYVSDVLRQVIENGGAERQKAIKEPFALTQEQRAAFDFSATPIPISEVTKRINALCGSENMQALRYTAIRNWLQALEMLEETVDAEGKKTKHPTARGESMGISLETRTGNTGTYYVVVYNLAAQHFILDNLDAVLELEHSKRENKGMPWSAEQDQQLLQLYRENQTIPVIADALKRNTGAIRARLRKLGVYVP